MSNLLRDRQRYYSDMVRNAHKQAARRERDNIKAKRYEDEGLVTLEELKEDGMLCSVTGGYLCYGRENDSQTAPMVASCDKIDPKRGYCPGNVQLVANWYNKAKSDWGAEETKQRIIEAAINILSNNEEYRDLYMADLLELCE